jgi:hypothetical protein
LSNIEEIKRNISAMTQEQLAEYMQSIEGIFSSKFTPNPGPQLDAYLNSADIMLYGGSAGSGKSALICGLALTKHTRSRILRRHYADLGALSEDLVTMYGSRDGYTSAPRPKLRTNDGRIIDFGACQHLGDEQSFQGNPVDGLFFDEVTQFLESQVRFIMGWNRLASGVDRKQRCRTVFASNPPTSSDGDWIIGFFRPWLDPTHSKPAKPGELRWFVTDPDGKDMEVDGPTPIEVGGRRLEPKSRTFIPGKLSDNPYLANSGYAATLDSMPEPLRSALRDGNFMLTRQDDSFQCIPSEWVRQAMARWNNRPHGVPMCAIGVDVAQGGADDTCLAIRYDGWFDKLVTVAGRNTPNGDDVAALVMKHRRDEADIILDMGGGYGGAPLVHLQSNGVKVTPFKGSEGTDRKTFDRKMTFPNSRSAAWWQFREALDPAQPGGSPIALPDDAKLLADLTAPKFEYVKGGFKVEAKDRVRERLGRSTDRADAVIMSWWAGKRGLGPQHPGASSPRRGGGSGRVPKVVMGYQHRRK